LTNSDLEFNILRLASSPISKSELWRKTNSQKQDVFSVIDRLVNTGNMHLTKEGNKHLVVTVHSDTDDITWNGILKFQQDQLQVTVSGLQEHKKLFKKTKTKTYREGNNVYQYKIKFPKIPKAVNQVTNGISIPIKKDIMVNLVTFSMQIDYLMQHLIKFQYALSFKIITARKAKSRIERVQAIITKEINKVMSDHPKDHDGLTQFVQLQTRTWNINV
jgi:hypothetical protein